MTELSDLGRSHQAWTTQLAERTSRRLLRLWNRIPPADLDGGWDAVAPQMGEVVSSAQKEAAERSSKYVAAASAMQGVKPLTGRLNAGAFAGVTREGRDVVAEMFSAVTTTKTLIGGGLGPRQALRSGSGYLSVLGGTFVHDAGRSADRTDGVAKGLTHSVRVVQPGACSRCAILAGVIGYRTDFERHPRCRCSSMPLREDETPDGFFRSADDYFQSLSESEQDRVFTNAGAEAIRLGADPARVVNARRGAYKTSTKRADGSYSPSRLSPITIGLKADGTPLTVYATLEGTTVRGSFGRGRNDLARLGGDRYRRTSTIRLMPEQIMQMSSTPERARELLERYGYLN